jgi:hypothetical protein
LVDVLLTAGVVSAAVLAFQLLALVEELLVADLQVAMKLFGMLGLLRERLEFLHLEGDVFRGVVEDGHLLLNGLDDEDVGLFEQMGLVGNVVHLLVGIQRDRFDQPTNVYCPVIIMFPQLLVLLQKSLRQLMQQPHIRLHQTSLALQMLILLLHRRNQWHDVLHRYVEGFLRWLQIRRTRLLLRISIACKVHREGVS